MKMWLAVWAIAISSAVLFLNTNIPNGLIIGSIATVIIYYARWRYVKKTGGRSRKERERSDRGEKPALIYIITYGNVIKVGIGDDTGRRLRDHGTEGWRVRHVYRRHGDGSILTRDEARRVERVVLNIWKSRRYPYGMEQDDMPQGGYTETTLLKYASVDETRKIVEIELGILRRKHWYSLRRTEVPILTADENN